MSITAGSGTAQSKWMKGRTALVVTGPRMMMLDNGGGNDEPRTDGAAARVGTWSWRIAGLGLGPHTLTGGPAQDIPETVVYVSNADSKEVLVLAMNRAKGAFELIEKTVVAKVEMAGGVFQVREDEPEPRVGAALNRTP